MKKRLLFAVFVAFLLSLPSYAQQSISQSWTENIALAPAAVVVGQNFSTTTATGATSSATGGSVAAGSYRIGVTCFSSSNTETPLSTDTAATAVVTTTGPTSTVTIFPPICTGTGNEVGWRPYIGASGGASGAETLQTLTATVCTLSSSSTASCALTSPAVFTASTNFSGGAGGPATPGTLIFPPIANQASQAMFEGGNYKSRIVSWTVTGTAPSACTFNVQTGSTIAGLASVGQTITCTATGSYALPSITTAQFVSINLATYTAGDTTTVTSFLVQDLPYPLAFYWGPATPTSNCPNGVSFNSFGAASASTVVYVCQPANTWTPITVP